MHVRQLIVLFLLMTTSMAYGQLVINELMQSNVDCVWDDANQLPDSWVELYNPSNTAEDLSHYTLSLTRSAQDGSQLPQKTVAGHGYQLVYCDKEGTGLHTWFRLESGKGGSVYLFRDGQVVDSVVALAKQPAPNIAYGRQIDGSSTWGYMLTPTPSAANSGGVATVCLPDPIFSIPGGVFSSSNRLTLTLSIPATAPAGTKILYTLDGSEPTASSNVAESALTLNFTSTRVVRAKLSCQGYLSPRSKTESYIFLGRQMTLPVISLATDEVYLTDNQKGILVDGTYNSQTKNYQYNWRRPMSFEFFTAEGQSAELNQLIEARVGGNASRSCALKSLVLYAHKRFGTKRLKYEFFPEQRPGQTDYESVVLRNAGNDFDYLYMRDAVIQWSMAKYQDLDYQAWQPAIIYINGVYRGILNIRERANEDNVRTNYNGLEDICMSECGWDIKAGTWDTWNAFKSFYSTKGHTKAEYEAVINVTEYFNHTIMELFFNNQDYPGNNIVFWRPMQASDSLPATWRLLAKDTDFGLGLYNHPASYNTMAWMYNPNYDADRAWANQYEHTRMFRYMMQNTELMTQFTDMAAIYMGDFLRLARLWPEVWQPMYDKVKTEYPYHRKLFNEWWPNYNNELTSAKNWLQQRPDYFINQLVQQYGLGSPVKINLNELIDDGEKSMITVDFNGITLSDPHWVGSYYCDRVVRLEASGKEEGVEVTGWTIRTLRGTSDLTTQTVAGSSCTLTLPTDGARIFADAIVRKTTDLETVEDQGQGCRARKVVLNGQVWIELDGVLYDLMGRRKE